MSKLKNLGTYCAMVLAVVVAFACTLVFTACGDDTPADDKGGEQQGGNERTAVVMAGDVWVFDNIEYTWSVEKTDENKDMINMMEEGTTAQYESAKVTIVEDNKATVTMRFPEYGENGFERDENGKIVLSDKEMTMEFTYTIGENGKVTFRPVSTEETEETETMSIEENQTEVDSKELDNMKMEAVVNGDKMTFESTMSSSSMQMTAKITMKLSK